MVIVHIKNIRERGGLLLKKTIKYLQNGEYHYATVKDVGDIDLLKTSNKDDLVSAINEIIVNGVADGISQQDQLDKINTDIRSVSADIAAKYLDLQSKISDGDATQASLRAQAIKDINGAIAAANAAIEKYKKANEEAVKATQADIDAQNNRIDRIDEQADALRTDLATAQTGLTQTKTDLSNAKLDFGKVKKTVVDLENEVSTKLSNADLDPLNQKIQSVESNVKQTKDELSKYVKHDEYDLTTGEVNKIKSNVQQLADRVETKVSRDTLNDDINEFVVKKANLLVQTRDWSIIDDVGWTFSNDGLIAIQAELYDHAHVLELHQTGVYTEQTVKGLHGGQSYTVSVSAKIKDAASGVNITLVGNNKTLGIMRRVKTHDTDISTEYERYEYTLVAPSDTLVLRFIATGMASSNVLYLYKAKLEEGTKSYEWEMNVNDIYAKVEKNSATLTAYDDRITGVVTKQRDFGTWKEQAQSTITQTADGLKINNQKLKNVNGDVVDVIQSKIDASADKLTSNYEKFTNQQVGMIVDEGTNQILNSAFTYYDLDSKDVKKRSYTFDSWQNISAKATIKSIGKANWVHMAQSGLSSDNPISITSNTFPVKQGKVIVGVDVLTPNVRAIDNQKVLVLQFYDDDGTRVDYREVSLHDLGLDTIQSNISKRGTYRVGIDRKDVTKMTVLARLPRNGEINFTNFFAKVSSLDNGDYQPNPADLQQQTIKQQTAIEQTADAIQLKADQTTVDTLDGTVKRQGTLIEQNAQHIQLKADGTTVTELSNKTDKLSQLVSKHSASLEVTDKAITQQASAISSVTTIANGANNKIDSLSFGGRNLLDNTDPTAFQKQNWNVFGQWWYGSGGNGICTIETLNDSKYTAKHYFRIAGNTGGNRDFQQNFVPEDTTYTFSVKIRLYKYTNNYSPTILVRNFAQKDGIQRIRYMDKVKGLSKDYWTDFSVTFSAHDIATVGGTASLQFGLTETGSVEFLEPQLEKASRPSDYSLSQNDLQRLASEDTASQINTFNSGTVQPIKGIANDALGKANSANNKIDGLRIGGQNLLKNSRGRFQPSGSKLDNFTVYKDTTAYLENGKTYTISAKAKEGLAFSSVHDPTKQSNKVTLWMVDGAWKYNIVVSDDRTSTVGTTFTWNYPTDTYRLRVNTYNADNSGYAELVQIQEGTRATEWQPSDLDLPDTIISTVTTTTNAKQIVDSSGIYSEVNKLVDTKVGNVTTQLDSYKHTVDDTGNKLRDVMGALKLDSNGNLTSNFNELIKTASGVEERYMQLSGKIDGIVVGGKNLINNSGNPQTTDGWSIYGINSTHRLIVNRHNFWKNAQETLFMLGNSNSSEVYMSSNRVKVERNTEYTLSYWAFEDSNVVSSDTFFLGRKNGETSDFTKIISLVSGRVYSGSHAEYVTVTFNTGDCDEGYIRFDNNGSRNVGHEGGLYLANIQLEKGNKPSDWGMSDNDINQKVAEAKKAADDNATSLTEYQRTVENTYAKSEDVFSSVTKEDFKNIIKNATFLKTADGFETTVKSHVTPMIEGGGVNLAAKTSRDLQNVNVTGTWLFVASHNGSPYFNDLSSYQGKHITVRVWIERPTADAWVQIWTNKGTIGGNHIKAGQSGYSTASGVIPTGFTAWNIPVGGGAQTMSFGWKEFKIELGEVATPWSPCPADIANEDYVNQHISTAKSDVTQLIDNNTKAISTIKQTADKVSISVGKMFGKADASSLDIDANGIKLRSDLIQLGTSDSYQNMVTVDPYDDKTTIPSSFYGGTAIDYRQYDGETRGIKKANVNNDYIPLSTFQPLAGVHPQDKIYFKMKFGNYSSSNCGYSLELWVYDGTTYRGKHVLASTSASSAGAIPARNWERIEGWWVAPSNLFYGAGNPRYVLAISGTKGFDVEVLRPRVSRSQMTDIRLDGDVTIAPGFQLKADYIKSGTLNTDNLIMKHPQGSTVTFTQDGFDVQKSDNREAFYTIGGDGMDFWRMSDSEAMNDYPNHFKPGYVHLGSLVALDNSYTKSTRRVDRLQQGVQQNKVSNDNGIGFIIDVTGGSDTFSILQKGAEYRNGDRSGRINFNDTVNNSHFPIWEVNATGFGSLSYPQSGYMHGRGILHYTNTYFYTDPVMGNEHNQSGNVNYHPSQRLGFVGNNGWGDLTITADNNNTMAVAAGSRNQNVWVNGFIFGSPNGADRIFGYDGSQWVDFVNKRTTRDNNDFTNHFASLHLWELQYSVLTHTSQLSKKTDIEPLDTKDFASKILSIDLYKYRYKTQDKNEKDNYGAIIDDVNEVKQYNLPQEFITTRDKGINDSHLITGLIATVQEQAKQIEQLSFRILELERGASING